MLSLPLSLAEASRVSAMLDKEPGRLADELGCSPAQARSLQQYVVLTVVVAFRRSSGGAADREAARARLIYRCMPPGLRLWLGDALRLAA